MSDYQQEEALSMNSSIEPSSHVTLDESTRGYLSFMLDNEEYAIDVGSIREIRTWEAATFLPMSERYVRGVINMRGAIVPILDLRSRFSLDEVEPTEKTIIILMKVIEEDRSRIIGIIVDEIKDLYHLKQSHIEQQCEFSKKSNAECVKGMARFDAKSLIILNQDMLL